DRGAIGGGGVDVDRVVARACVDGERAGRIEVVQRDVVIEGAARNGQAAGGQAADINVCAAARHAFVVLVVIVLVVVFISLIVVVSFIVIILIVVALVVLVDCGGAQGGDGNVAGDVRIAADGHLVLPLSGVYGEVGCRPTGHTHRVIAGARID